MNEQSRLLKGDRPSFARIGAARGRVGVVDVGSNSVRLVVFDEVSRAPDYFFNEKVSCGLGVGMGESGRLSPEGRASALVTLKRFAALAARMRLAALEAVATAAVRDAADGRDFAAEVERETGLRLEIVSGEEEARLSAQGVLLGAPGAEGAMVDMGGASMELAGLESHRVGPCVTLALGPQRLAGLSGGALTAAIDAELERGAAAVAAEGRPLHLVGGAWRAFAKLEMTRRAWPIQVLHGFTLAPGDAAQAAERIAGLSPAALKAEGVSGSRAPTAPLAAAVLGRMIARFRPTEIVVSAFGLREGVFFRRLPLGVRRLDPLIEACRRLERLQARFPGFGEPLFGWLAPALGGWDDRDLRLARAACLLNDVSWRVHPDYRPLACFETTARANLAGLDHADRAFMGFALAHRYGGGQKSGGGVKAAVELLPDERRARARALGRGIRFGAMLGGSTGEALAETRLEISEGRLALRLSSAAAELAGEPVGKRLGTFAEALGLAPEIVVEDGGERRRGAAT